AIMSKRLSPPAVASLDATDRAILAALAEDARIATSELARQIGLSAPATADRVRRLEAQGVIAGFTVELDPRALGYTLQAIVRVKPLP
ncbi:winged helix-turn-helix transcriptional regulator, partial [Pseudomonas sp. SIMBA_064]